MDSAAAALSHQVFGPQQRTGDGGMRSQAEGIVEKLTIFTWPKGVVSDDAKLSFLAFFTAYGRSDSPSPSSWATWAFSYIVLCFPEMKELVRAVNEREYQFSPLPLDYVTGIVNLARAAEDYTNEANYRAPLGAIPPIGKLPDLNRTEENFPPDLAATATIQAVYGYCALLIFMAGKKINEKNVVTITERRPQNLIDAYSITEDASYSLIGEGKMGSTAHKHVNQAWVTYAPVRVAVVTEVAKFARSQSLPQRVVYTLSKMMEYAGMQQGNFIHVFLQAMPQCVEYSCIRPSLNAYISSTREVAAAPAYLQPYYKVINGEQTRAFHRNSVLVLSACALAYAKYTSTSLMNFNLGEGATAAVNMYDAEAARRGDPTLQNLTFKETSEDPE